MCYSVLVETNLKKLEKEFSAKVDMPAFERVFEDRARQRPNIQIPAALEQNFVNGAEFENRKIQRWVEGYHKNHVVELEQKLFDKRRDIQELEKKLETKETKTHRTKLETAQRVLKRTMGQFDRFQNPSKEASERVFQYSYAPLITKDKLGLKKIHPFRYQLRPGYNKEEVPSRINMFNARTDALNDRRSWQRVFMHRHAALIMNGFYEWVEDPDTGKSKQIQFNPENGHSMWVPCLYDRWESEDKDQIIDSFALLTRDPPQEIQQLGHDRCPVFPKWEHLDTWLNVHDLTEANAFKLLDDLEPVHYDHIWVGQTG